MLATITLFLSIIGNVYSSSCGESLIPFSFETLPNGQPVLGCARPLCFGWKSSGEALETTASFYRINQQPDGFIRNDPLTTRPFFKESQTQIASRQKATCEDVHQSLSCDAENEWVGGIVPLLNVSAALTAYQCCTAGIISKSTDRGIATVNPGQIVMGGEIYENDILTSFDYISNVEKTVNSNGSVFYNVNIRRFDCSSNQYFTPDHEDHSDQTLNQQLLHQNAIAFQAPIIEQAPIPIENVQNIVAPPPVQAAPAQNLVPQQPAPTYWYPANSQMTNPYYCFTDDTEVRMLDGSTKRMDKLEVNDWIGTIGEESGEVEYVPVQYWIHRVPGKIAEFRNLEIEDGSNLKITGKHLIYKVDCLNDEMERVTVTADQLNEGDCLIKAYENTPKIVKVKKISKIMQKGIFSPMTGSGSLLVNDIYASCQTSVNNYHLQYTFFSYINYYNDLLASIFGNFVNRETPYGIGTIVELFDLLVPKSFVGL